MTNPAVAALIERSNRLGSDPKNTNYAGGNTSAKGSDTDPVTGEDVEQCDVLEQVAGPLTKRLLDVRSRDLPSDDDVDVLQDRGEHRHRRRRESRVQGQCVDVDLHRARPLRQMGPLEHRGVEFAGVTDRAAVDRQPRAAAGMPRALIVGGELDGHPRRATDRARRLEGIEVVGGASRPPGARGIAQSGEDDADVQRLMGH